jgi:mannosyltransferase
VTGPRAAVLGLTALGALLRFSTLGVQHLWLDEAVTQGLMQLNLHDLLTTLPASESTPPLYYLVARAWVVVFGSGEVGLRALSALAGTLTIPVAYSVGSTLASREAGLVTAALAAVSPALVWYSQEARAYALLVLLCALSLLFLARALRGGGRPAVAWWAVTSMLAVLTHYFAGFLVAGEALWLLAAHPERRISSVAVGAVGVCCVALLPLAVHQSDQGNLDFIERTPLAGRIADIGELFLAGPNGERLPFALPLLAALTLVALVLVLAADAPRRRAVRAPALLTLAGVAAPVLLALLGPDYVLSRNFLPFWLPAAFVVAAGLSAGHRARMGVAVGGAVVAASIWVVLTVTFDRTLGREAATAGLVPDGVDASEEHIAPRVAYAVADRGEAARAMAPCPGRYRATSGGAVWLSSGADEPLPEASTRFSRRGKSARASPPSGDDGILSVYAICVRPLD